jgi:hypothetical protein
LHANSEQAWAGVGFHSPRDLRYAIFNNLKTNFWGEEKACCTGRTHYAI